MEERAGPLTGHCPILVVSMSPYDEKLNELVGQLNRQVLGKSNPFLLTKSDPHEEHDFKKGGNIIHAEGVRVVVTSSALADGDCGNSQ